MAQQELRMMSPELADEALEDRLGAFEGQRQHEGGVGVGPGCHEEGDLASTVGEVDVDVPEIGLEPPTWQVSRGMNVS